MFPLSYSYSVRCLIFILFVKHNCVYYLTSIMLFRLTLLHSNRNIFHQNSVGSLFVKAGEYGRRDGTCASGQCSMAVHEGSQGARLQLRTMGDCAGGTRKPGSVATQENSTELY